MPISQQVQNQMKGASWIRRMFEQGVELKKKYGERSVFDLTLGNPMVEPPASFRAALREAVEGDVVGAHRYMPNIGYEATRAAVARSLAGDMGVALSASRVVMTVGAASALNVVLKSLLNPGEEVIVLAPFFPEYRFYVENHGGKMVVVGTSEQFDLDVEMIAAAMNDRTKAIIVNSPNNPTGVIYGAESFRKLNEYLEDHRRRTGRTVYVVSDEPYRKIVYETRRSPSPLAYCRDTVLCSSHSKDLAIPGERIGFAVVGPDVEDGELLLNAMAFNVRTLGFVNAPALMQRVVAGLQDDSVSVDWYREKRDRLYQALVGAGYDCRLPGGAFYFFPKCPIEDDVEFVRRLAERRVLAVPGSGFGVPGYFRLSYCCEDWTVDGAIPILEELGGLGGKSVGAATKATKGVSQTAGDLRPGFPLN
ncbi:MAG: pyridoxal phosphate-dependent aminotransferase [Deltaproteobacteria bacterium]|nr:pyridoxal phosphate-dependent aminotransferase [Deltaproteobacteria bacterium]